LEVSDPERALELAGAVRGIRDSHREKETIVVDPETDAAAATLLRVLISSEIEVYGMQRQSPSLEEIFFGLTEQREGVPR
jgi:hypothetical protein